MNRWERVSGLGWVSKLVLTFRMDIRTMVKPFFISRLKPDLRRKRKSWLKTTATNKIPPKFKMDSQESVKTIAGEGVVEGTA